MADETLCWLSLHELAESIRRRRVSSVAVVEAHPRRVAAAARREAMALFHRVGALAPLVPLRAPLMDTLMATVNGTD